MLLAIDIGNTNIVFGLFNEGESDAPIITWRCSTKMQKTDDEYAVWFLALLQHNGLSIKQIKGAVLASVVPSVTEALEKFCRKYLTLEPLVVKYNGLDIGFDIHIDRPQELGADRIVNTAAALAYHGQAPFIIVDFGTATTFDIVDEQGNYCGGVIAPGPRLSLEALHLATAKLPRIDMGRPEYGQVIAKNTVQAMQSGVYWGYISLIEGMLKRLSKELGGRGTVIATGGLAVLFKNDAKDLFDIVDINLTMKGLVALYYRNRKQNKADDKKEKKQSR